MPTSSTARPYNNNGLLIGTGAAAPPRSLPALTDGQLLIGRTGYAPLPGALTGGYAINATGGAGSLTVDFSPTLTTGQVPVGRTGLDPLALHLRYYDARLYGAVGDGTTDNVTFLQAAIDAASAAGGGVVYIPSGTYRLTTYLTHKSDVSIVGDGMGNTIIKRANSADVAAMIYISATTNCQVHRLTMDGNYENNASFSVIPTAEILIGGATDTVIADVEMRACRSVGLTVLLAIRVFVRGCLFRGTGVAGSSPVGLSCPGDGGTETDHLLVDGCTFINHPLSATDIGPCIFVNNYVSGCAFEASGGQVFINGNGGRLCIVANNLLENGGATHSHGFEVGGNIIVANNIIDGSSASGVYVHGPIADPDLATNGQTIITGNLIRNSCRGEPVNGSAVYVEPNMTDFIITNNVIYDTGTAKTVNGIGIGTGSGDRYRISGNLINNVTTRIADGATGTDKVVEDRGLTSVRGYLPTGNIGNVTTGEDDLRGWAMLANTITSRTGVRISAMFTFASNTNAKTVKLHVGGSSVILNPTTTAPNGVTMVADLWVWWASATSARVTGTVTLTPATLERVISVVMSTTIDFTTAVTIKFTGEGTASNDILQPAATAMVPFRVP